MKFLVANDNGNSEHKIAIDGVKYHQPNVYVLHNLKSQSDQPIDSVMESLLDNIIVTIDSQALDTKAHTYTIGKKALEQPTFKNMNIGAGVKHIEDTPIINTLGILAAVATQKKYNENKQLNEGETIELEVDMTTALPATTHDEETKNHFAKRFIENYHEVKVHYNNTHTTVKIKFNNVKVTVEGIPALFSIIENVDGGYRNDDIFDEFKKQYNHKKIDGQYFRNKRLLHVDIGDGTTELTFTVGYKEDKDKSKGLDFGFGQTLSKASTDFAESMKKYNIRVKRQDMSNFLRNKDSDFHQDSLVLVEKYADLLVQDLLNEIKDRARELKLAFDVIVVYGGGSILIKEYLYPALIEEYSDVKKEILWIPEKYAVDMNLDGMEIYNSIAFPKEKSK